MNEYEGCVCQECMGSINQFGFCEDCGFDFEQWLDETRDEWDNLNA